MKRLFLFVYFLLFISVSALCQSTARPFVESQYRSQYGSHDVVGVVVRDGDTYVLLEDITPRGYSNLWISFSDKTVLSYSGKSLSIKYWGYWDGDEIQEKEFNQRYSLQSDRRYCFVLVFPSIPNSVNKIDVEERISGGFFWRGIHLTPETQPSMGENDLPRGSYRQDQHGTSYQEFHPKGSGTCFAINSQGYIATCYHVVEDARRIKVRGVEGDFMTLFDAKIVVTDPENDLAILKINDSRFSGYLNVPYTISGTVSDVGENVFVLGYPLRALMGDEIKLTNGIISSKSGYLGDSTSYQISATVQPGNSGGPLFDENGNVVGIINARLSVESASYAIKSPYLKMLAESSDTIIHLSSSGTLSAKSLKEKVKDVNKYIYIIEVE